MSNDRLMARLRLKDRYKVLCDQIKRCQDRQKCLEISAEMAAVRREAAALEPKRPRGRPRKRPAGTYRSKAKGTPSVQSAARVLRKRRAIAMAEVREVQAQFDQLARLGGPTK